MGNHEVGRAMGQMAGVALKLRTNQTALELLDAICEPYRNTDAEFEEYTEPDQPLGKLIAEAFAPTVNWVEKRVNENDDDDDCWYEVYRKFRERFDFW